MKGFRSNVIVQGYSVGEAEMRYTPNGKAVTSFTIGVGGNREKNIKGVMIRCIAWEDNAEPVLQAVGEKGLAVLVEGRLTQRTTSNNGKVYVNNDLNIDKLMVQLKKSDTVLANVEIVRSGSKAPGAKAPGAKAEDAKAEDAKAEGAAPFA